MGFLPLATRPVPARRTAIPQTSTQNSLQNGFLDIPGIGQLAIACNASNVPTIIVRRDVTDEYVLWNHVPDSADAAPHLLSSELTSAQPTLTQSFGAHGGQAIIQIAQGTDAPSPSPRTTALITVSVLPDGDASAAASGYCSLHR